LLFQFQNEIGADKSGPAGHEAFKIAHGGRQYRTGEFKSQVTLRRAQDNLPEATRRSPRLGVAILGGVL